MTDYGQSARDDLMRYRDALRESEHLEEQITRLESQMAGYIRAYSKAKVKQEYQNKQEELMARLIDLWDKYAIEKQYAISIMLDIEQRILDSTKGIERRILRSHYLSCKRLIQIAEDENYSYQHIKRYHQDALHNYGVYLTRVAKHDTE